jgi:hypothetical protein
MSEAEGADVLSDPDTRDRLKPKSPGSKRKSKYWLKEWQWYAVLTVAGLVIILMGALRGIPYMVLAGIALSLFSSFGISYGLLKERQG